MEVSVNVTGDAGNVLQLNEEVSIPYLLMVDIVDWQWHNEYKEPITYQEILTTTVRSPLKVAWPMLEQMI